MPITPTPLSVNLDDLGIDLGPERADALNSLDPETASAVAAEVEGIYLDARETAENRLDWYCLPAASRAAIDANYASGRIEAAEDLLAEERDRLPWAATPSSLIARLAPR